MLCSSPCPYSLCLPPPNPFPAPTLAAGAILCLLSSLPAFPQDAGVSCRFPRSSNPTAAERQFRMHREESGEGEREVNRGEAPQKTPTLRRTGHGRGEGARAKPGEVRLRAAEPPRRCPLPAPPPCPPRLPANGGIVPDLSGEDRVSRSLQLGEHQCKNKQFKIIAIIKKKNKIKKED